MFGLVGNQLAGRKYVINTSYGNANGHFIDARPAGRHIQLIDSLDSNWQNREKDREMSFTTVSNVRDTFLAAGNTLRFRIRVIGSFWFES